MPGYDSQVIMAAGAFVQGSSIELSADGPMKPPYAVYFQGGLTWEHAKLGVMMSVQKLYEKQLIQLDKTGDSNDCKESDRSGSRSIRNDCRSHSRKEWRGGDTH